MAASVNFSMTLSRDQKEKGKIPHNSFMNPAGIFFVNFGAQKLGTLTF